MASCEVNALDCVAAYSRNRSHTVPALLMEAACHAPPTTRADTSLPAEAARMKTSGAGRGQVSSRRDPDERSPTPTQRDSTTFRCDMGQGVPEAASGMPEGCRYRSHAGLSPTMTRVCYRRSRLLVVSPRGPGHGDA